MITFFLDAYDLVYNYLTSVDFAVILAILKITSYLISLTLAILIGILLKRADAGWWIRERLYAKDIAYGKTEDQRWLKIQERLKKGDEANLKLAVIEANNLLDDIFKRMSLPGRDMGERLKQVEQHEIKSINGVLESYKVRNKIVHDSKVRISLDEAEEAVKNIEAALRELEYLQ